MSVRYEVRQSRVIAMMPFFYVARIITDDAGRSSLTMVDGTYGLLKTDAEKLAEKMNEGGT